MAPLYVALLHHPVYDKNGEVVSTAVTNMDVHDLARIGKTYGIRGLYIATPVRALRLLAEKIIEHWEKGFGARYNETRRVALALVRTVADLDGAILEVERDAGEPPRLVATSAREGLDRTSFASLRGRLLQETAPHLLVLGTGWGLAAEILERSDVILEPIRGVGDYNHLPVRAAAAIILDRLVGGVGNRPAPPFPAPEFSGKRDGFQGTDHGEGNRSDRSRPAEIRSPRHPAGRHGSRPRQGPRG